MKAIKFFIEGDLLYADMFADICAAKRKVDIESYIFADDEIGQAMASLLIGKVIEGVNVRLMVDAVGSMRWRNKKFFQGLKDKGILVHWFNPWSWKDPLRFNRRNHRKLVVIDDDICFVGGFNIHAESSRRVFGERRWKDNHVKFSGALGGKLANQFELNWRGMGRKLQEVKSDNGLSRILPNHSRRCRRKLRCEYLRVISQAQCSVVVTTPYFVPDHKMIQALQQVASRGVKVSIIVPKYNDHALLKYAAYWYYRRLISSGIEVFEYVSRMLHAKALLIDERLVVVGSANMDYRSFFLNSEIMIFSEEEKLVDFVSEDTRQNLLESESVTLKSISRHSRITKLFALTGYLLRRWL